MIKIYCDRCKRVLKNHGPYYSDNNSNGPENGSYFGKAEKIVYQSKNDADENPFWYGARQDLCENCQKELNLMVTEFMGVKKR